VVVVRSDFSGGNMTDDEELLRWKGKDKREGHNQRK
jgi:hypothetical protein